MGFPIAPNPSPHFPPLSTIYPHHALLTPTGNLLPNRHAAPIGGTHPTQDAVPSHDRAPC